jgi:hypothetical protein
MRANIELENRRMESRVRQAGAREPSLGVYGETVGVGGRRYAMRVCQLSHVQRSGPHGSVTPFSGRSRCRHTERHRAGAADLHPNVLELAWTEPLGRSDDRWDLNRPPVGSSLFDAATQLRPHPSPCEEILCSDPTRPCRLTQMALVSRSVVNRMWVH